MKIMEELVILEHDICSLDQTEESFYIECKSCIMNDVLMDCSCVEKIIHRNYCAKCDEIENKINGLREEVDKTMYHLSYNIKNYANCDEEIDRLRQISQMLRLCNRLLQSAQSYIEN